jgi:hypothetical protein
MRALLANVGNGNVASLGRPAHLVFGACYSRYIKKRGYCTNKAHRSLNKTCVYTEDNVQTGFNVGAVIQEGWNSNGPFSPESTTKLDFGASKSKEGNDYSQFSVAGLTEWHRLAACLSPVTVLPNSCVDPFFKPPIRLSAQELEAVDHSKCHVKNF